MKVRTSSVSTKAKKEKCHRISLHIGIGRFVDGVAKGEVARKEAPTRLTSVDIHTAIEQMNYSTPSAEATSVEEIPRLRKQTSFGTVNLLATPTKAPSLDATSLEARTQNIWSKKRKKVCNSPSVEENCSMVCAGVCL